ncbi:uncharacterized protein [Amphiura filiformis]|uniref:uncharacterized protein n=1 Tax=Amphiura filiformis TaxID=82378 RepID=UPI003B215405
MAPSWLFCLLFPTFLYILPCAMSPVSSSETADFWHKFCRLFCPFPAGCSADVYLSLQQKQMLLQRKGLLATLQSFPQLLQDSDKLQHTALVKLEEHQRALVLMRYKDFFHPRETLPEATAKPNKNDQVATPVTSSPDARTDDQQVQDTNVGLDEEQNLNSVHTDLISDKQMRNHADLKEHNLLRRTSLMNILNDRFSPDVSHHNNISPREISAQTQSVHSHKWDETNVVSEEYIQNTIEIENTIDIVKFQQILSALPDAVLFNALCRKCAASVRERETRHGRKLLRLILQNKESNYADEVYNQNIDNRIEFRTQSELFNSIGRPETMLSDSNKDNYMPNAIDYPTHLSDVAMERKNASGRSQSIFELGGGVVVGKGISGLPENTNYQSIVDQFRKAEASRQWQLNSGGRDGDEFYHGYGHPEVRRKRRRRRRGKRMVMKTQVCPVVQSWSNLVLAKTANGTLVQIAQFPEVNLEQWFLEEKCKYPISPILDDVTCESKDRLVDAVIIPVSNPTLPIQTMKIKIQSCVSMYNLDDRRN